VAFNVMSRIEEVITADNHAREKAKKDAPEDIPQRHDPRGLGDMDDQSKTTLLDFMGWNGDAENKNDDSSPPQPPEPPAQDDGRLMKLPNIMTNLKQTYMDKLDFLGGHRSPTGRH
jgi:hypothetical protein